MGDAPKVTRIFSEGWFVPGEARPHTEESFKAATQELADLIKGFVEKHDIGVIVGLATPTADNPNSVYQAAIVFSHAELAELALGKLVESVKHTKQVSSFDKQNQN